MTPNDYSRLEDKIAYRFQNPEWLTQALCHPTYVNENKSENLKDNQRLEFLGDAVLGLVVGSLLMEHYPEESEGELTRIRAGLVREERLSQLAKKLNLGKYLLLGKGESQAGGATKPSILADTLEALLAAVYLDGGFQAAFDVVKRLFVPLLSESPVDAKTRLQEILQKRYKKPPVYQVVSETGPDHDKIFFVVLSFEDHQTEGSGKSKKQAEQDAAQKALVLLTGE
jgi:ribonuclease III